MKTAVDFLAALGGGGAVVVVEDEVSVEEEGSGLARFSPFLPLEALEVAGAEESAVVLEVKSTSLAFLLFSRATIAATGACRRMSSDAVVSFDLRGRDV